MQVVGFLFLFLFGSVWIYLAVGIGRDAGKGVPKKFLNCPKADATVLYTREVGDEGANTRYRYHVTFTDLYGQEALGISDTFIAKRTLRDGQAVEVYFRQSKEVDKMQEDHDKLFKATAGVVKTLFNKTLKPLPPDNRPRYSIHFCDNKIYANERKSSSQTAVFLFLFGSVWVVLGILTLLGIA